MEEVTHHKEQCLKTHFKSLMKGSTPTGDFTKKLNRGDIYFSDPVIVLLQLLYRRRFKLNKCYVSTHPNTENWRKGNSVVKHSDSSQLFFKKPFWCIIMHYIQTDANSYYIFILLNQKSFNV